MWSGRGRGSPGKAATVTATVTAYMPARSTIRAPTYLHIPTYTVPTYPQQLLLEQGVLVTAVPPAALWALLAVQWHHAGVHRPVVLLRPARVIHPVRGALLERVTGAGAEVAGAEVAGRGYGLPKIHNTDRLG